MTTPGELSPGHFSMVVDDSPKGLEVDTHIVCIRVFMNDDRVTFLVPTDFWSLRQYARQWAQGIVRLMAGSQAVSCLIMQMPAPEEPDHVVLLELQRCMDTVFISERYVAVDRVPDDFGPANLYGIVSKPSGDPSGERISLEVLTAFASGLELGVTSADQ